jgi:branched-chain amino acid transport system permease protein
MTLRGVLGYWMVAGFVFLAALPFFPGRDAAIYGTQLIPVFCFAILALALNVVVGYTGLLHLGIAAFFGIGAYTVGILSLPAYPFQWTFVVGVVIAFLAAAAVGVMTTAPTLRLRGDYLALVTLGFGLILTFSIRNLEEITGGTKGMNPVAPQFLPGVEDPDLTKYKYAPNWGRVWTRYPYLYYLALCSLAGVMILLRNLERSRLGRAWVAIREDELAASCMGLNPAKLKLAAIALGAGLAGFAGAMYAVSQNHTGGPDTYNFNRSMITLCCVILGGLGNRPGVILGVFILVGYDNILTPLLDNEIQKMKINPGGKEYLKVSGWRLFIFGIALILMMRYRPEGLLPAVRMKHELHPNEPVATAVESGVRSQESGGNQGSG